MMVRAVWFMDSHNATRMQIWHSVTVEKHRLQLFQSVARRYNSCENAIAAQKHIRVVFQLI